MEMLLVPLGEFGDSSPITGNRTVFNTRTIGEFKFRRFVEDQKVDKVVSSALPARSPLRYSRIRLARIYFPAFRSATARLPSLSFSLPMVSAICIRIRIMDHSLNGGYQELPVSSRFETVGSFFRNQTFPKNWDRLQPLVLFK